MARIAASDPAVGITYDGLDARALEAVLPLVDYVEVTPDSIARSDAGGERIPASTLDELEALSREVGLTVHGVGLSIGSAECWSEAYLRLLDQITNRLSVAWHSEHLGYVYVEGQHIGTMLPVPCTHEALDLVCERVIELQQRYRLPFLLENIVHLLPQPNADYSDAEFINILAAQSGCGVLLDVYNLECDAQNNGLDLKRFLGELRLENVGEVHVACGVEHAGVLLDVHSRTLRESTLRLARAVTRREEGAVPFVTYELLAEAVPLLGIETICDELRRLRATLTMTGN